MVVGGAGAQVILGNNQVVGPSNTVLQANAPVGQHGAVGMYQGVNSASLAIPPGTSLLRSSAVSQGTPLPQASHLQPGVNIQQGLNLPQNSTSPVQNSPSASAGVHPGNSVVGVHQGQPGPGLSISQTNQNMQHLNVQQAGVNLQSNTNSISIQQNMVLGLPPGTPSQMNVQQNSSLSAQHNVAPIQPNTVLQQVTTVNPSPAASPALSGGSLPPPSPLSTRMTPPIVPSSSRSELQLPQFVKVSFIFPSLLYCLF